MGGVADPAQPAQHHRHEPVAGRGGREQHDGTPVAVRDALPGKDVGPQEAGQRDGTAYAQSGRTELAHGERDVPDRPAGHGRLSP